MAYSVKYTGESHQLGGSAKHFVIVYADTAADMPEPDPAWAAGSELIVMEDGGAKYRLNNAGEWVESSFDAGGGGVTEEYVAQKIAEESKKIAEKIDLSGFGKMTKLAEDVINPNYTSGNIITANFDVTQYTKIICTVSIEFTGNGTDAALTPKLMQPRTGNSPLVIAKGENIENGTFERVIEFDCTSLSGNHYIECVGGGNGTVTAKITDVKGFAPIPVDNVVDALNYLLSLA